MALIGRAAGRLGMAQPPLSRAIRDLERQLGVALLERTTRQVRLTAAGEVLLRDARTALDAVTARRPQGPAGGQAVAAAAGRAQGRRRRRPAAADPRRLLRRDAALPPELVLGAIGEQPQACVTAALTWAAVSPFDDHDLDSEPLLTEPLMVALAAATR